MINVGNFNARVENGTVGLHGMLRRYEKYKRNRNGDRRSTKQIIEK